MNTPTGNPAGPQAAQGAEAAGDTGHPGPDAGQAAPGNPHHQAPPEDPPHPAAPGGQYHQTPPGGPTYQAAVDPHPPQPPPGGQYHQTPPGGPTYQAAVDPYPPQPPPAGAPLPPAGYGYAAYVPSPQYAPGYGYYAAPSAQVPPLAAPAPQQSGFESAFNEMADKSGLGMLKGFFSTQDGDFWKGALVGAAVVILMTNDELRNSLLKGAAKTADAVKSGFGSGDDGDEDDESAGADSAEGTEEENEV